MRKSSDWSQTRTVASALIALTLSMCPAMTLSAFGQNPTSPPTFQTLFNFSGHADGGDPSAALTLDESKIHLYGTTYSGGANRIGTVFELTRQSDGSWAQSVLYNFGAFQKDCFNPDSPVILDKQGNLYGTTIYGGVNQYGCIFQLSPDGSGGWTEHIIHSFHVDDGAYPSGNLAIDNSGNLYGSGLGGRDWQTCYRGCGTVFELSPKGDGNWTYKDIGIFDESNGNAPNGVTLDRAGNLWGGTFQGGAYDRGVVFELTPQAGQWSRRLIHSFDYTDGSSGWPGAQAFGDSGQVFGETGEGGVNGYGTVFELIPSADGQYNLTDIYSFGGLPDGVGPRGNLVRDQYGRLYGTTFFGGGSPGGVSLGTIFELAPGPNGWQETILHSFDGNDGDYPLGGLITDGQGHFYGTTSGGGSSCCGTVFEITP